MAKDNVKGPVPACGAMPSMVGTRPVYKALRPPSLVTITRKASPIPEYRGSLATWKASLARITSRGYVKSTDIIPRDQIKKKVVLCNSILGRGGC